ncbi:MAG: cobalt transporter [Planctomycetes bacterium]|nr:cobalt transporter [Planctomycetota bacterium]
MHSHAHEVTLGLAFVLGALHAVEPGHGKSAMLVYLSGGRRSSWHPIVIGLSSGIAHSVSLIAIAAVVHLAQHLVVDDHHDHDASVTHSLQWVSAILVLAVGGWMWWSAARKVPSKCGCKSHRHECRTPPESSASSYSMSALLGIAFGLLPCPSALAAYFASMSTGSPVSAYAAIALFAVGIACALSLIGILLQWIENRPLQKSKWLQGLPWPYIRAGLIQMVGCFYLLRLVIAE